MNDSMKTMTTNEIRDALETVPQWKRIRGMILRKFEFRDFVASMVFVNSIARLAELAGHHPDIDIRWNEVTLKLVTHDAGGLTAKDFELARRFDSAAR